MQRQKKVCLKKRNKKNTPIKIEVTILGTGTSQGVPVIGCQCEVCRSTDPRDKRLRVAAMVEVGDRRLVIDCGPDFRQQMLRESVNELDAILLTHEHNDHIIGMDDVRPFNFSQQKDMPVYATDRVAGALRQRFSYVFDAEPYPGAPKLQIHSIDAEHPFTAAGIEVIPVAILHGDLPILGFRIGDFAYLTDVKTIPEAEMSKLRGLHTLVINALHFNPHHTHLNVPEALEMIEQIQPKQAFLTHVSHRIGLYAQMQKKLPAGVGLAYDGLRFVVENN